MQQDNNHQFDSFARKVLSEEPAVPEGFEWENMGIEIPEKKKRFPFFYPLLISSFIVFSFVAGYFIKDFIKSKSSDTITASTSPLIAVNDTESSNTNNINNPKAQSKDLANNTIAITPKAIKNKENNGDNRLDNMETSTTNNTIINRSQRGIGNVKTNVNNRLTTPRNENVVNNSYQSTPANQQVVMGLDNTIDNVMVNEINKNQSNNTLPSNTKDDASNLAETGLRNKIIVVVLSNDNHIVYQTLDPIITMSVAPMIVRKDDPSDSQYVSEIVLLAGANINKLSFADENVLQGKIENVLGQSLGIRCQRELNTHLLWNTSVQYDEYHTVFNHNREVSRDDNYTSGIRTITNEQIYQNNYSRTLSLSSGLSLRKALTNKIALQANLAVGATYLLSRTGKTLIGDEVVQLADVDLDQGVNVNIQPSLDLRYSITDRFGLQLSYINRYSVGNAINVNQEVKSIFMHQFMSGISMNF